MDSNRYRKATAALVSLGVLLSPWSSAHAADGDDFEAPPAVAPATPAPNPPAATASPPAPPPTLPAAPATEKASPPADAAPPYAVDAWIQGQYESHQDSQNELRQGALLNQNRFLLRRARLRVSREWQNAQMILELDGTTTNGAVLSVRKAEASVLYRGDNPMDMPPMIMATMGIFDTPFGAELVESPRTRHFMERSLASRSLFPGEPDVGARLSGALGFFRYSVAVVNGEPIDERTPYPLRDPNSNKDLVARIGADAKVVRWLRAAGGISVLRGKGFHPGTSATKNGLAWRDLNEDGQVQQAEIAAVPATAATPSESFDRWAVGADLSLVLRSPLGETRIFGEVVVAQNLDRGFFVADPVISSIDVRERGSHVGFTQEITPYGLIGFRTDVYDPNADTLDKKLGKLLPSTQRIRTYSPLVGLVLPGRAKLLFQVDFIKDYLGRDPLGVPADLRNNQSTLRLQVNL